MNKILFKEAHLAEITREQTFPRKSFFLFGPRGVGKSTLLKQKIKADLYINLLKSSEFLTYKQDPDHLFAIVTPLKENSWVVIDEIQRVPELLNIVHEIYETKNIHFALSGSSARKLKRGGANLLAGRALKVLLYPFSYSEFKNIYTVDDAIAWGTLPSVVMDQDLKQETLAAYVETYLREELIQEGIIRKSDSFLRFLKIAGIMNGQSLNFENISRESHTGRTTVQTYFEILVDTLIAFYLPAYQPALKVKEVSKPKFYFFDSGVARACAGLLSYVVDPTYHGYLFETFLINQIKSYNDYSKKKYDLFYYGISGGHEIDLIIETKKRSLNSPSNIIAVEFKLGNKWKSEWKKSISILENSPKIEVIASYIVYTGTKKLEIEGIKILNVQEFLIELFAGKIF